MSEELIKGCIEGHERSRRMFYDAYATKIFGVCRRYISNTADAEDVFQEAFVSIFKSLDRFDRSKGSIEAWICRIAINSSLMWLRKNAKFDNEDSRDSYDYEMPIPDKRTNAIEEMGANEALKIIETLPPKQRAVFNLYAIEGYTHREIGEMMGISEGTSKSQFSKARANLSQKTTIQELARG